MHSWSSNGCGADAQLSSSAHAPGAGSPAHNVQRVANPARVGMATDVGVHDPPTTSGAAANQRPFCPDGPLLQLCVRTWADSSAMQPAPSP